MRDGGSGDGCGTQQQASAGGLLRVVWFRQMLHRWQSSSAAAAPTGSIPNAADVVAEGAEGASPTTDQHGTSNNNADAAASAEDNNKKKKPLPRVVVVEERRRCAEDEHTHQGGPSSPSPMTPDDEPPADVPCGCCAVYVGAERRRFVVPTAYLGMPVFARLLEKAEEEFGFDYHGAGITIPCDTEAFKYILVVMEAHRHGLVDDEGNPKNREEEAAASKTR